MKKLLLALVILTQAQAYNLESYYNARFDFYAKYPSNLFTYQRQSDNGDGITLKNKSKNLEIVFYGNLAVENYNIKDEYRSSIRYIQSDKNKEITYKRVKRNWFVLSGYDYLKRVIFYRKTFFLREEGEYSDERFVTYIIEYPIKDKKRYNNLVKVINNNFQP